MLVSISIITIRYSFEGYLPKFGIIPKWLRITLFLGGLLLGFPWYQIRLLGLFLIAVSFILGPIIKRENLEH